jgi:hypothetical protein
MDNASPFYVVGDGDWEERPQTGVGDRNVPGTSLAYVILDLGAKLRFCDPILLGTDLLGPCCREIEITFICLNIYFFIIWKKNGEVRATISSLSLYSVIGSDVWSCGKDF